MVASIRSRADIDPDVAVDYFDRIAANVICPGVEGAAATQVETGMVPVAREDLAADASTVEGKAHVWASVIERVDCGVDEEQDDCLPIEAQDELSACLELRH